MSEYQRSDVAASSSPAAGKATLGAMVATGAPLIVPSRVLGRGKRAPSDTVNVAIVGFGGMGSQNALVLAQTDHIGAVCDVDFAYSERRVMRKLADEQGNPRPEGLKLQEQFGKAKRYRDFREMLAKEKSIDGSRDCNPGPSARRDRKGGDGSGQARLCAKAAGRHGARGARSARARAAPVQSWSRRWEIRGTPAKAPASSTSGSARASSAPCTRCTFGPIGRWSYWPQGLPRPTGTAPAEGPALSAILGPSVMCRMCSPPPWAAAARRRRDSIGTCISDRLRRMFPIIPSTTPSTGAAGLILARGALGDMGAHLIDHPFWALGLDLSARASRQLRPNGAPCSANRCPIRSRLACTINSPPAARSHR